MKSEESVETELHLEQREEKQKQIIMEGAVSVFTCGSSSCFCREILSVSLIVYMCASAFCPGGWGGGWP